ncbi:alanine racemase [soil metagenome]
MTPTAPFHRPSWAEVSYSAIRHNLAYIREKIGPKPTIMAVVKSNAYGHGDVEIARVSLEAGATSLGVATTDEALKLRHNSEFANTQILVMAPTTEEEIATLQDNRIDVAIGSVELLRKHLAYAARTGRKARLHPQVDTGIGRDGFRHGDFTFLSEFAGVEESLQGIFTHFAVSDEGASDHVAFTHLQQQRFESAVAAARKINPRLIAHSSNSGAIIAHPETYGDMVRPGIMLYGADPTPGIASGSLRQVIALKSRIAVIKEMEAGDTVSYGRLYEIPSRRRIGIIPIGYGDGYPRSLSQKGSVLVHGKRAPIRGRVCMDQIMVDLHDIPTAQEGDEVVLYGAQGADRISLEEAAALAGTIPYELTCQLTARIPRVYVE